MSGTPKPADLAPELQKLLPELSLLPDEDPVSFEGLREALLADLSPGTAYERALAENLVVLEWESHRHRRLRDRLIIAEYRDLAMGVFYEGEIGTVYMGFDRNARKIEAQAQAYALVSDKPRARASAEKALAEQEISSSEILAKAYAKCAKDLEPHERKLAEVEGRRRRLRDDYDRLRSARLRDAEISQIVDIE